MQVRHRAVRFAIAVAAAMAVDLAGVGCIVLFKITGTLEAVLVILSIIVSFLIMVRYALCF